MNKEQQKQLAAQAAVNHILPQLGTRSVIGIGTGSTAAYFITALAAHKACFEGAVASSEASAEALRKYSIPVYPLNDVGTVPFYVDGADEVDVQLRMIKGGGGALTREKILAQAAEQFICIADSSKYKQQLKTFPVAVEVIGMARSLAARMLAGLGGQPVWRKDFVTDNGNPILDVHGLDLSTPKIVEREINDIPGVVCNGIFAIRKADCLIMADDDGKIRSFS